MRQHPLMTTALLLSLSLYTACGSQDTPSGVTPHPSVDVNGNITPFPKGPKELDGISTTTVTGLPICIIQATAAGSKLIREEIR